MRDQLARHTHSEVRSLRSSGLNRQIGYSLSQFLQMHTRLTACGMHRYFSSSAASGGSITTHGYSFLVMRMRLTACGVHRYFSSSAASGGSITTYGYSFCRCM